MLDCPQTFGGEKKKASQIKPKLTEQSSGAGNHSDSTHFSDLSLSQFFSFHGPKSINMTKDHFGEVFTCKYA